MSELPRLTTEQTVRQLDEWEREDRESPEAGTVESVLATMRRWLWLPDPTPVLGMLATLAANELPGDPIWLMLVGAPGSGKSEILNASAGLPEVHEAATLTEGSLLSGTSRKERAKSAKGGLLREIGDYGIILAKDFGSILSMHHDARGQVLAALREIYDGSWTRHVGTDGGQTLAWKGRVGFLAGATPTIDRHHSVLASMGERFVTLRMPEADESIQADQSFGNVGREGRMRDELGLAVRALFGAGLTEPEPFSDDERQRVIAHAVFAVAARSATYRDSRGNLEYAPPTEAPGRLVKQLAGIINGLSALRVPRDQAWPVVTRMTLDCLPPLRLQVIDLLCERGERLKTGEIVEAVDNPRNTVVRALEDLTAHKVIKRWGAPEGKAHMWELRPVYRDRFQAVTGTYPGKSEGVENNLPRKIGGGGKGQKNTETATFNTPIRELSDFSGEVSFTDLDPAEDAPF